MDFEGDDIDDFTDVIPEYSQVPYDSSVPRLISHELSEGLPMPDQIIQIKSLMCQFTSKTKKQLKKEYVRVNIIRRHKKIIRSCLSTGIALKRFNKSVAKMPCGIQGLWKSLAAFYYEHRASLEKIGSTANGPKTDGKSRRCKEEISKEKSFNDNFCKKYFSENYVRQSFYLFIEYLFADNNPEELCLAFKYFCCNQTIHSAQCASNWLKLKEFFLIGMFEDLELLPLKRRLNHEYISSLEELRNHLLEGIWFTNS